MRKILEFKEIAGLQTMTIQGRLIKNKIGDIVIDNNNNTFKIVSVAFMDGKIARENDVLVVEPIDKFSVIGDFLNIE